MMKIAWRKIFGVRPFFRRLGIFALLLFLVPITLLWLTFSVPRFLTNRALLHAGKIAQKAQVQYFEKNHTYTDELGDLIDFEDRLAEDSSVTFRFVHASASGFTFFTWLGKFDLSAEGQEYWFTEKASWHSTYYSTPKSKKDIKK